MAYRVIQWGTGFVGKMALRATIEHPDLELVGLIVHGQEKDGRDAGELIALPPVGVIATDDVSAAENMPADVVSYFANADLRPADAVQDMARSRSIPISSYPAALHERRETMVASAMVL